MRQKITLLQHLPTITSKPIPHDRHRQVPRRHCPRQGGAIVSRTGTLPRFAIIGLNGAVECRFNTREYARVECDRLHKVADYDKQDAEDQAFCARYGVPFQPRRYFVMQDPA